MNDYPAGVAAHHLLALVVLLTIPIAVRAEGPAMAEVSTCFSPGPVHCADVIADAIDAARTSVRVQAYWFTSRPILRALAAARKRGIDVAVILDRSQDRREASGATYTAATYLTNAGIPVFIDPASGIAHNKVIILDATAVVTGSFNFTAAADTRNAENVVILRSPEVADWYGRNWTRRQVVSRPFGAD